MAAFKAKAKARKGQSGGGIKLAMNETIFMILALLAAVVLIYVAVRYGSGLKDAALNIIEG